jgi:hypothetical protein
MPKRKPLNEKQLAALARGRAIGSAARERGLLSAVADGVAKMGGRHVPDEGAAFPITTLDLVRLRRLLAARRNLRMESLKLWEPLPGQLAFHCSWASERLIRGSNQSGKTLTACVEIGWAATGQHPFLDYPSGGMEIYLVAKDEKQIAEVWWKKLCCPGAFDLIKDLETGEFRSYRPWEESDKARKSERIPAPPLIPEKYWAKKPMWKSAGAGVPHLLTLKNGTRIHFFTGNARPTQGTQIHMAAFDEEIGSEQWYSEIAARLLRFNGRFIWSATPQAATEGLYDLHLRAEDEREKGNTAAVTEHFLHITANPHISDEAKAVLLGKLTDPEQRRVRWDGEYAGSVLHIFPEFSIHVHGVDMPKDEKGNPVIPKNWTRYMVVDPGSACCAVLFAAVPPPEYDSGQGYVYLYDELYLKPCKNSDDFAKQVKSKVQDDIFYEFVIDSHSGRTTEVGSGLKIQHQYARALQHYGVTCESTGSNFLHGMDDVQAGDIAIHDWLHIRTQSSDAKLRVVNGRCPNLEWEMGRYRRKKAPDGRITEKPVDKDDHLVSCLRYLRGRNPKWHPASERPGSRIGGAQALLNMLKARERQQYGSRSGHINLGPGSGRSYERSY